MSSITCQISISLDGFVAGPHQSLENPIGEGGLRLHHWVFETASWREQQGEAGGFYFERSSLPGVQSGSLSDHLLIFCMRPNPKPCDRVVFQQTQRSPSEADSNAVKVLATMNALIVQARMGRVAPP